MKQRGSIYVYIVFMVFALVTLGLSLAAEHFRFKVIPLIVSGLVLILAALGLSSEILAKDESGTTTARDETDNGKETRESWYRYSLAGTWIVGFLLAILFAGLYHSYPPSSFLPEGTWEEVACSYHLRCPNDSNYLWCVCTWSKNSLVRVITF